MLTYDLIVIGFGKAGKTLAATMASHHYSVALVEENAQQDGGSCINIACIPTKTMLHAANQGLSFTEVMNTKNKVVTLLRQKNVDLLKDKIHLYHAHAQFVDDKVIELTSPDETVRLTAKYIVINTGSSPIIPNIPGIHTCSNVFNSTQIQTLPTPPKKLGIIGAGPIGLEFAELFSKLGSEIMIFNSHPDILPHIDPFIRNLVKEQLQQDHIELHHNSTITSLNSTKQGVSITTEDQSYEVDAILYATGRQANTQHLGLENTRIQLNTNGSIQVNEYLETTVEGVFAVGDVNGGPQFTYVSLDDFRIVSQKILKTGTYSRTQRPLFPATLFITPPLAHIGLSYQQALQQQIPCLTKDLLVSQVPRAHVNQYLTGGMKAVVHRDTKEILGVTLFCQQADEIINLIALAMNHHIPYTALQTQLFTHPTMSESLNDLFKI